MIDRGGRGLQADQPRTDIRSGRAESRATAVDLEQKLAEVTRLNQQLSSYLAERNLELESERERVSRLLEVDDLTGLLNRRRFEKRMEAIFEEDAVSESKVVLLKIDIDDLKSVNLGAGYETGDVLLKMVAARITDSVRDYDTVARLGGDKFAILCTGRRIHYSPDQLCERILAAISQPFHCAGHVIKITASIGASSGHSRYTDRQTFYRKADVALERAKAKGGDCFVRDDPSSQDGDSPEPNPIGGLRAAIRSGDIDVHFQPQVDSRSGRATGLEALARWQRSDGSSIPPKRFVAIAEENGDIRELGLEVLRTACRKSRPWIVAGLVKRIAVNVSPRQLDDRDVIERISEVVAAEGFDPAWLELEITERTLVGSVRDAGFKLKAAHDLGATIALDDFGTGYSNLSSLKRLPLDVVKIDKSFVDSVEVSSTDRVVVEAIVGLAKAFCLRTVAEGVETASQSKLLADLGCDTLQGHYYARPMHAEECEEWLRRNAAEIAETIPPGR